MSEANPAGAVGDAAGSEVGDLPGYFPQLTKAARQLLLDRFGADGLPRTQSDLAVALARPAAAEVIGGSAADKPSKQVDKPDVPDSPDGYTFSEIKLPDGTKPDPLFEKFLRESGVEGKLSKEQAKALYKGFHEQYLSGVQANFRDILEKQKPEADKLLRDAWKDSYDDESAKADKVLDTFGDDDLKAAYEGSAPRIKAVIRRFAARIGDKMSPDSFVIPEGPTGPPKPKAGQFAYGFDPTAKR